MVKSFSPNAKVLLLASSLCQLAANHEKNEKDKEVSQDTDCELVFIPVESAPIIELQAVAPVVNIVPDLRARIQKVDALVLELQTNPNLELVDLLLLAFRLQRIQLRLISVSWIPLAPNYVPTPEDKLIEEIAHDLKNSLQEAIYVAEKLITETIFDERKALLEALTLSLGLARELMDCLEKPDTFKPEVLSVRGIIRTVQEMFPALPKNITLTVSHSGDDLRVFASRIDILRTVENWLLNAIEVLPDHGQIHLTAARVKTLQNYFAVVEPDAEYDKSNQKSYIAISVIDNGPGMTKQEKRDMALGRSDKVVQGQNPRGIGFRSVVTLAERNGDGFVHTHSKPGEGTQMTLFLPPAEPEIPPELTKELEQPHSPGMVVFLDDQKGYRNFFGTVMQKHKVHFAVFSKSVTLLKYIDVHGDGIAAIVLDNKLDDGATVDELVERLRNQGVVTPVVVHSATAEKELGLSVKIDGYIPKRMDVEIFRSVLGRYTAFSEPSQN